jgi:hypothetical protein
MSCARRGRNPLEVDPRREEIPCNARDFLCARGDLNSDSEGYPQSGECQEMPSELVFRETACQAVPAASSRFLTVR